MTAPGQLDLDGGEAEDPRVENVAKALFWRDAKRTWWGREDAKYHAEGVWPRVRGEYMATAQVALAAADS